MGRQNKWARFATTAVLVASFPHVAQSTAAATSAPAGAMPATETTEEVVVRSTPFYELRAAIIAAEERFYARYNELNKVDDFDVECSLQTPTGTRFRFRTCHTRLVLKARRERGDQIVQMIRDQGDGLAGTSPSVDPDAEFLARAEEYKMNVLYLLKMNPDLRRLVREREAAEKRYDAERRRRFKER